MGKYQRGSVRRLKGKNGDSWEWRYRIKGMMKQETYPLSEYPNEASLWKHLEPAISRLNNGDLNPVPAVPTMGDLAKKYKREYLPKLAKSTQDTDISMIDVHIVPRWGEVKLANIRPPEVESWIESLDLSSSSRGRARRTMKQMFDRAMFWGLLPLGVNPMTLVKVRGSS
jgi:Phage integrase, N-terminal SAM-like domain